MAKLVLDDIGSTLTNTAATTINNNNNKIEQALENTLSRDGSTPNNMQADIDMDSNDILNVKQIDVETLVLNGEVVQAVEIVGALKASNALSEIAVLGLQATARDNIDAASDVQGAKADNALPRFDPQFLAGASRYPVSIDQRLDDDSWVAANTIAGKNSTFGAAAIDGLTWVNTIMPGTDGVDVVTSYSISPNGKYASVDAVRASDNVALTRQNILGHTAVALVDNPSVGHFVWGKYTHAWWDPAAHVDSFLLGEENSVHKEGGDCAKKTPWELRNGSSNFGQVANLRLTAGTGLLPTDRATNALQITANNAKYGSGIIIASDALDVTGGYADGLAMSTNHGIGWYSPSGTDVMWRLFTNVTSVAAAGSIILGDGNVQIFNASPDVRSASHGYRFQGTKVVGARDTGWVAMTGTANENTVYDTASVTLPQLAGRVKALQDALTTHGLIGT